MRVEVKVPQLPESVAEATLVSWHKQPGEAVRRDENLIDVETGERGYLLTGRDEYLQPYRDSIGAVGESLRWLEHYYERDAVAEPTVEAIKAHAANRLAQMESIVSLYGQGREAAWRELLLSGVGKEHMNHIRAAVEQLLVIEPQRISAERQQVYDSLRLSRSGVATMVAVSATLSLTSIVLFCT